MGLDTNILVYALDPEFPEHTSAKRAILELEGWCLNPTVVQETYHTLVFKRRMQPSAVEYKIFEFLGDDRTAFANQTKAISKFSLRLAVEHGLGGRDALIIGCYLYNGMEKMLTHDEQISTLGALEFENKRIRFIDPVKP